jgi:bifunctional non-homologous end joining protein LigD
MPDTTLAVDGRRLRLSNLDKVLYPAVGFTKGEVIHYYAQVAQVLLPHLRDRPVSLKRYPDGVDAAGFFAKNVPKGAPDWVRTVELPTPGSTRGRDTIRYVLVQDTATLLWIANLAGLEVHVPQWRVARGGVQDADRIVFDLDPGPPASIVDCCRVACLIQELLNQDGLRAWPKTSGSKGLHLYVPIVPTPATRTRAYARSVAQRLAAAHQDLVEHRMVKALRPGKVLIDWSQNNAAKTTVAPYSLRARDEPTVSTPVSWEEVQNCAKPEDLRFVADTVVDRIERDGDLAGVLLTERQRVPRDT